MRTNNFLRTLRGDTRVPPLSGQKVTRKLPKPWLSIVAGLMALGLLLLAACGGGSKPSDGNPTSTPVPASNETTSAQTTKDDSPKGALASNLDFPISLYQGDDVMGATEVNFSEFFQGKPVVLNFWAGLCPPCRAEIPDFQRFHENFSDRVTLFGLDVGPFTGLGSNENGKELIQELGVSYPVGSTTAESVMREYRVLGMPSTIFMTNEGKIFRNWGGILDEAKLIEITEEMLALP